MKIKTAHRLYMKNVSARRKRVEKMRQIGMKWSAIAAALGVSRQRAQQIGKHASLTDQKAREK